MSRLLMGMLKFIPLLCIYFFCQMPADVLADEWASITKLKKMHVTTTLVENNTALAVIVAPADDHYRLAVSLLQERIKGLTGVVLPVYPDDAIPEEVLRQHHVIALGNMATNRFIEKLYRQWQVILDLKYPGAGGYVVRSLHNPYGTARNVIFLGGSDDAGVAEAERVFAEGLQGKSVLSVGWLMKIKLGTDLKLPEIGANRKEWRVYSWMDSWRANNAGGYKPSTFFGWNSISVAGVLYYMTGRKEYLDTFKELAMPDPLNVPAMNKNDESFTDPLNPLVKNYHYRSHLVDCVYDLIEESPQFTDKERLFITNKLLEHQREYDPKHTYSVATPDRHAMWHMLSIYTGSRYFANSYPDIHWNTRIDNVRRGFRTFINNPFWGDDTLQWVATYLEPAFEFFVMDGAEEFVRSGTARSLMDGLEVMMSGEDSDYYNNSVPVSLLHKASYLLHDGRYIWMARQLGFDFDAFRIGQSYWPKMDLPVEPPVELVGKTKAYQLAESDWKSAGSPVSKSESFQVLSYRSGLGRNDDYLLLDGFNGLGAHPYQLNTLLKLRMFKGKQILDGNGNDIFVWRNGLVDDHVPRSAALKNHFETEGFAYILSEVPDMSSTHWQRHILYRKDKEAVVVDRITAAENGDFDVRSLWQMGGTVKKTSRPTQMVMASNGIRLSSADTLIEATSDKELIEQTSRKLLKGQSFSLANMFNKDFRLSVISSLADNVYFVDGNEPSLIASGDVTHEGTSVSAGFLAIDNASIFLAEAKELSVTGVVVFHADAPVTLYWDLKQKTVKVTSHTSVRFSLAAVGQREFTLPVGEHLLEGVTPDSGLLSRIKILVTQKYVLEKLPPKTNDAIPATTPVWKVDLKERVSDIQFAETESGKSMWVVSAGKESSTVTGVTDSGSINKTKKMDGVITSFHVANTANQSKSFAFIAGFKNDMVRAFSPDVRELWKFKADVDASFRIGDHYNAPWFTDPGPKFNKTGIFSLLVRDVWGSGNEEIVVGRPSTVEFHGLDGSLLGRTPIHWGNVTTLVSVKSGKTGKESQLLAGKYLADRAALTSISRLRKNMNDNTFSAVPSNVTNMHAFNLQGIYSIIVNDINNDGTDEVVYVIKGHWNEIRAYDGTGRYLWSRPFGPGKGEATSTSGALAALDLYGDGRKEIVVTTENGWMLVLDSQGKTLWQKKLSAAISALAVDEATKKIAAGCSDGSWSVFDGKGIVQQAGKVDSSVTKILLRENNLYLATDRGSILKY